MLSFLLILGICAGLLVLPLAAIGARHTKRMASDRPPKWIYAVSIALGFSYGIALRFAAGRGWQPFPIVMSWEFTALVPFAIGFVTVFVIERRHPQPKLLWLLLPWAPVACGLGATLIMGWEGVICIVLLMPFALISAGLGGLVAGLFVRYFVSESTRNASLMLVAVLPLVAAPIGQRYLVHSETRTVATFVDIKASPEIVWGNIARVPAIHAGELPLSWSRAIGFPAPIEATLSTEGVGAVRHATFAKGVLFIENVDKWEPGHRLAFSIHAQTDHIPATTLDEHVRIGGPYFDVLRGEYVLEPLPNGITRLHLYSNERLSTDFNWYAQLWTDSIMRDLQNSILYVIKNRCEKKSPDLSLP